MTVEAWLQWFEDNKPDVVERWEPPPMPRPKKSALPAGQLTLFTVDGRLWCDAPANNQKRYPLVVWQREQKQTG